MVRKCRGVAEIAVMEVDVRSTRAQPPDFDVPPSSSSPSAKKRKLITGGEFEVSTTTSFVKLRSRRRRVVLPENSVPSAPPESIILRHPRTSTEERTSSTSPSSDGDDASAFCCSSNGCSEVVEEKIKFVDLEDENEELEVPKNSSRESRETTPSSRFRSAQSDHMESPAGKSEASSGNRSLSSVKMPTELELEEFFISAEKNIQKRFAEKYNYDIVDDVPLEGRYEWIRLKP